MVEIIPAILETSRAAIEKKLDLVRGLAHVVQIDVVDGIFAKNTTWPNTIPNRKVSSSPDWHGNLLKQKEFVFEIDLMVMVPEICTGWISAGASRLVIHATSQNPTGALQAFQKVRQENGIQLGIALSTDARASSLEQFEGLYDFVQVMGIEKIGFQGQPFDDRAIALITEIHKKYPDMPIQVDGGVSLQNARILADAGAARLIVGSHILDAQNPHEDFKALYNVANAQ